jgi:acetoin utilization protein AcuC
MLHYNFGGNHPLKPERLARTIQLLSSLKSVKIVDPGKGNRDDVLRIHDREYVDAVELISSGYYTPEGFQDRGGFGSVDNPPFLGMYEASLAYVAGVCAAARDIKAGDKRAFCLAGGLHHALRNKAAGFCVFNDAAIAIHILQERFNRIAYVDIDVHHGDGVQWIWYNDPTVLTCSIHEDGKSLFPGSGAIEESGQEYSCVNVPLEAKTTGDVWLWAFERTVMSALDRFSPQAIVLQMGADLHHLDPLGHIKGVAQEWLNAVQLVHQLDIPILAIGGGGYNLQTVPRMWASAYLTLTDQEVPERLPEDLANQWGCSTFMDTELPEPRGSGWVHAEIVVERVTDEVISKMPLRNVGKV